jgi:prepilin-type N-terminal cleavage/methylation domain-containing protein
MSMTDHLAMVQCRSHNRSCGFTLVEMAVVVVIMALILGSILVPLSTQVEQRQIIDTQRQLEEIRVAVIGYSLAQAAPILPCPDKTTVAGLGPPRVPNDGFEDRDDSGKCEFEEGNVPWATLGLAAVDPWGNRYRYRVSRTFSDPPGIDLTAKGDIWVCTAISVNPANCSGVGLSLTPNQAGTPVALLLSHGPNGWGAVNASTSIAGQNAVVNTKPGGLPALGADEAANADGNPTFVSRPQAAESPTNAEFDDIVIWLSPYALKHRLVAAGKLP